MSVPHAAPPIAAEPTTECGWYRVPDAEAGPDRPNLAWCHAPAGHPEVYHLTTCAERVPEDDPRLVALSQPADRPSFDELLAAADDDELASAAVYGVTSSPELVPGLSFGQAAQINARISAHVAVVDAAAAILGPHLEQHRLDLLLRRHERLGLHLGYEVTPTTSHDCRLKLLWTPHDVHLVTYAPVADPRPGMPGWEVATDARFEAHAGRALSPAVIAAAAIAAVDTIEAS